jgi:hypothetical protein
MNMADGVEDLLSSTGEINVGDCDVPVVDGVADFISPAGEQDGSEHLPYGIGEKDKDDQRVVLVTCDPPNFLLVGWMFAGKAKLRNDWIFKSEKGRCWMVPQSELENINAVKVEQAPCVGEDEWLLDL